MIGHYCEVLGATAKSKSVGAPPGSGGWMQDVPYLNILHATADTKDRWCYRVLRRNEEIGNLREPNPEYERAEPSQLRLDMLRAIAFGNDPAAPSQFLHGTRSLSAARNVFMERLALYQPTIVRWPMVAVDEQFRYDFAKKKGINLRMLGFASEPTAAARKKYYGKK